MPPRGNRAFSNLNEGLGKVLRFGANDAEVLDRLKWMAATCWRRRWAPRSRSLGELELKPLMAQALHMGDEVHNRNAAASALLFKRLAPALSHRRRAGGDVAAAVEFIAGNDHFFLNLSMAACKAMLDAAHGVAGSSIVTAMARNGVEFGIRVSGIGDHWFTAPAPLVNGLYFPGYTTADAAPDLGDSAITETAGLGGFAMAAVAGDRQVRRRHAAGRLANTLAMTHITLGAQRRLHPAGARFRRHAGRHRRAARRRHAASCRSSTPASRTRSPASGRSAPASRARRWAASRRRSGSWRNGERDGSAVLAIGGNALIRDRKHESIPDQYEMACGPAADIAGMIESGWNVVVTHGNGPQVGFILRRSELAINEVPPVPMDYAGADIQGAIGYMFVKALRNEFRRRGIKRQPAAIVTQTVVDRNDPAFADPMKPIGSHMDEARAKKLAARVPLDGARGRRARLAARGASPKPQLIVETDAIRTLVEGGFVVVACGGGGIPVIEDAAGDLQGVEAVIDKDLASACSRAARRRPALVLPTGVEKVALDFGKPTQRWLDHMTRGRGARASADNQFDAGSMGPKIAALIDFVGGGGRSA